MSDGIAMVKRLLGLPGMNVLEVTEGDDELVIKAEAPNYRRRLLLGCGIKWTTVPTHRIRGRQPAFAA